MLHAAPMNRTAYKGVLIRLDGIQNPSGEASNGSGGVVGKDMREQAIHRLTWPGGPQHCLGVGESVGRSVHAGSIASACWTVTNQ